MPRHPRSTFDKHAQDSDERPDGARHDTTQHAEWVREHPQIGQSGFPEYPDEPARRGASRGATPNGNPWRPIDPHEKPGDAKNESPKPADPFADTDRFLVAPDSDVVPPDSDAAPTLRNVSTQPSTSETAEKPAIVSAATAADETLGRDISEVLAASKALEGTHLFVEVVEGDIYLYGTVADQSLKSEVEQLVSSVRRAKEIHNELDVRH